MIVVTIIGILALMAIPAYKNYISSSSEKSCLMEVKAYANLVYTNLNDQDKAINNVKPILSACSSITDASSWNVDTINKTLIGIPKYNEAKKSQCDLNISPGCTLVP